MAIMTSRARQELLREVEILPEKLIPELLSYARFLHSQSMSDEAINARFDAAIESARTIADREGITDAVIDAEIEAYRSSR